MELKTLNGVQIFSAGEWNGDKYTNEDLDDMVTAFQEQRSHLLPHLKLGHDDNQALLQNDGYPAAGWVGNIYRSGNKLIADFIDLPNKIFDLIAKKAYRKVSCEIYWDIVFNGKKYPHMLSAVSLLGGNTPAVNNLDDMLALYGLKDPSKIKCYATEADTLIIKKYLQGTESEQMKTEFEIKLEADLEAEKAKSIALDTSVKKFTADVAAKDQELAELKKFKQEADERAAKAESEAKAALVDKSISEIKAISPSMKPYVLALIGEDKKEYSVDKKTFSKVELLKEVLKLYAANSEINFEESTDEGDDKEKNANTEAALNARIEAYAKDNKVSYKAAYKAVHKELNKKA